MKRDVAEMVTEAALVVARGGDYAAVVLADNKPLIRWWEKNVGSLHPNVIAHHMTIVFQPSETVLESVAIGEHVDLNVIGYGHDDKCQAVVVKGYPSKNKVAHITVATNGVGAVYSNKLLAKGWEKVEGPKLQGRIGYDNGDGKMKYG